MILIQTEILTLIMDADTDGAYPGPCTEEEDYDADGEADYFYTHTYDDDGNRLTYEIDYSADGVADKITTWTYDGDGNNLTNEWDEDADGEVDGTSTYTYDNDGNKLTHEWKETEEECHAHTYTYDDNGNMLTEEYDRDADGEVDEITTWTYDCWLVASPHETIAVQNEMPKKSETLVIPAHEGTQNKQHIAEFTWVPAGTTKS